MFKRAAVLTVLTVVGAAVSLVSNYELVILGPLALLGVTAIIVDIIFLVQAIKTRHFIWLALLLPILVLGALLSQLLALSELSILGS